MKKATLLFCALWFALSSPAQQKAVSINETGAAPDASSILDVQSTTKGILFPRMTSMADRLVALLFPTYIMLLVSTGVPVI
ncbi:MAG: hypothetical protein HY738_21140 [Bacteroidia bacterium]|nr:hypothetical protein [Bacteroidia bacterium]